MLLQRIKAYSCQLQHYNTITLKFSQNKLFTNNQRQCYHNLISQQQTTPLPPIEDTVEFWRNIWSHPHEIDSQYVTEIESIVGVSNCMMKACHITPEVFRSVIANKTKNWAAYYAQNFTYYTFEHCPKIKPIMLKIMLSKSRLCSRTDCFIRV